MLSFEIQVVLECISGEVIAKSPYSYSNTLSPVDPYVYNHTHTLICMIVYDIVV